MANNVLITPANASLQFTGSASASVNFVAQADGRLDVIGADGSNLLQIGPDSTDGITFVSASNQVIEGDFTITGSLNIHDEGYQIAIVDDSSGNISEILSSNTSLGFFADRADAVASSNIIFSVDNTTALTLDANQSASFVGNIGVAVTPTSFRFDTDSSLAGGNIWRGIRSTSQMGAYQSTSTGYLGMISNHDLNIITNDTIALTLDASQNATFVGDVSVGGDITIDGQELYIATTSGSTYTHAYFGTGTDSIQLRRAAGGQVVWNSNLDTLETAFSGKVTSIGAIGTPSSNAQFGWNTTQGLVMAGQGSSYDITIQNDLNQAVLQIPTGTRDVEITSGDITINDGVLSQTVTDATTNAVTPVGTFTHLTSGTAANGIGTRLSFQSEDDGGTTSTMGYLNYTFTDVTDGAEKSNVEFWTRNAGSITEKMSLDYAGNLALNSGDLYFDTNNKGILGEASGGGNIDLLKVNSSDIVVVGSGAYPLKLNGTSITLNGDQVVSGSLTISGSLVVLGETIEAQITELYIEDKIITVASGSTNGAAADGAGIEVDRGSDVNVSMSFNDTTDVFDFSKGMNVAGSVSANNLSMEDASTPTITLTDTTNTVTFKAYSQDTNAHIGTTTSHYLYIDTNDTAAITIDTSQNATFAGNVGIGGAPSFPLDIYINDTTTTTPAILVEQDGTGDASINFLLTGAVNWSAGIDNSDGDSFKISKSSDLGNSNYFTIDGSGNTEMSGTLGVSSHFSAGTAAVHGTYQIHSNSASGSAYVSVNAPDASNAWIAYNSNESIKWLVGNDGHTAGNTYTIGKATGLDASTPYFSLDHSTGDATFTNTVTTGRSFIVDVGGYDATTAGQGAMYSDAVNGVQLHGSGSTNDLRLLNSAGTQVLRIPTGTTQAVFAGALSGITTLETSGLATLASATVTGDLTVDTNTFFANSTNNRVGIGTTAPTSRLHVVGTTALVGAVTGITSLTMSGALALGSGTITTTGAVGTGVATHGTGAVVQVYSGVTSSTILPQLMVFDGAYSGAILVKTDSTTAARGGQVTLARSNGSTNGLVNNGDVLGAINFAGADGADYRSVGASIVGVVSGTAGVNDMPASLKFYTTQSGNQNPTLALTIDATQVSTFASTVITTASGGFKSATTTANDRTPIWRVGDADAYGFSYFRGTASLGTDGIGFHLGTATAAASILNIIPSGIVVTGNATISGNVSGSSTTTGSFAVAHIAGRVGIGTSTPSALLHISSTADTRIYLSDSNAASANKNAFINSDGGYLTFGFTSDDFATDVVGLQIYAGNTIVGIAGTTSQARLTVKGGGVTASSNALYISDASDNAMFVVNNAKKVGIGTATPSGSLHVFDGASGQTAHTNAKTAVFEDDIDGGISVLSTATAVGRMVFASPHNTLEGGFAYDHSTRSITARAGASAFLTGTSSGSVGIGTTSPLTTVDIESANTLTNSRGNLIVRSSDAHSIDYGGQITLGGSGSAGNTANFGTIAGRAEDASATLRGYLALGTSDVGGTNSEKLRIKSNGNVGIGTTVPDGTLHVFTETAGSVTADANADNLIVENSAAGGISILTPDASWGNLYFGSPSSDNNALIQAKNSTGAMNLGTVVSGGVVTIHSGLQVTALTLDSSQDATFAGNISGSSTTTGSLATVLASNKLGVGTTNPTSRIHVGSYTSGDGVTIDYGNSSGNVQTMQFNANGIVNAKFGIQMRSSPNQGDLWMGGSGGQSFILHSSNSASFNSEVAHRGVAGYRVDIDGGLYVSSSVGGASVFKVEGTSGSLFEVVDTFEGTLMSVNDSSGVPIFNVSSSGNIGINKPNATSELDVNGTGSFTYVSSSRVVVPTINDAANPTIAFGDGDTGFYEGADDSLRVAIAGTNSYQFTATYFAGSAASSAALVNIASTATVPSLIPNQSDLNTGIGRAGGDLLSLVAGGVEGIRINGTSGVSASIDLKGLTNITGSVQVTGSIYTSNSGSIFTGPSLDGAMLGALNVTGYGSSGARVGGLWLRSNSVASIVQLNVIGDTLEIGGGGSLDTSPVVEFDYGSNISTFNGAITGSSAHFTDRVTADGSVAAPAFRMQGDTDTGLYPIGADNIGLATGGTKIVDIASTGVQVTGSLTTTGNVGIGIEPTEALHVTGNIKLTGNVYVGDRLRIAIPGSLSQPAIYHSSDSNTGFWWEGVGKMGAVVDAVEVQQWTSTGSTISGSVNVYGASGATGEISLKSSNGKTYNIGSTGTTYGSANNFIIYDVDASAERLRIDTTGEIHLSGSINISGSARGLVQVLGDVGYSASIDTNAGDFVQATVTGSVVMTFTNAPTTGSGGGFILELTNGGSQTVTWPTSVKWPSGTAPTLTAAGVDVLTFVSFDAGTTWRSVASQLDSK